MTPKWSAVSCLLSDLGAFPSLARFPHFYPMDDIAVGRALPAVSFLIGGYHSPNRFPHFNPMDDMRGENKKNWAKSNICIIIRPFMTSVESLCIMNINSSHT